MMKILVAFSLFLAQMFTGVHANTCDSIHPPSDQWVRGMANDSKFIFYGTITSVVDRGGSIEEVGFKIDRQLKGRFSGTAISQDWGPGYPVKANETRVFFVGYDNVLLGCSDYKYYFTDRGMQAEIRSVVEGT